MKEKNLFEIAIEKNETNDFFRGDGVYFFKGPDYEGHVHGERLGGAVALFIDQKNENIALFNEFFAKFISSLDTTETDLGHLLANLSAYFALRSGGALKSATIFSEPGSKELIELEKYMRNIMSSAIFETEKERILRHALFLKKHGSDLLVDILDYS